MPCRADSLANRHACRCHLEQREVARLARNPRSAYVWSAWRPVRRRCILVEMALGPATTAHTNLRLHVAGPVFRRGHAPLDSQPASPVAVLARLGFFREIGGVSYCIYIIHATVFLFCHRILLYTLPAVTDERAAAVTLLAALITYAIAKLSWEFLEEPLLRRGHAYSY